MIEKLMFDLGNVLLKFDFGRAAERMAAHGADPAAMESPPMAELKDVYESGGLTTAEFIKQTSEITGYRGSHDFFEESWQDIFEVNEPMVAFLRAQSASGMPCYLLSNSNDMHVRHIRDAYTVLEPFQDIIFSNEVKLIKPNPNIFHEAIKRFAVEPEKTLYIDDLKPNIDAGAAQGFQCLHYDPQDHAAAESQLEALGLS